MVDKLPFLPDDHHYAIAAVATRSGQLESAIESCIAVFFPSSPRVGAFILKNMNGDRYMDLLKELLTDLSAESDRALVVHAFQRIKALRTERNEILHWLYGESGDPTLAKYVSMRPHRDFQERTKTAAQIQAVAEEMLDMTLVTTSLTALAMKLVASPYKPETPDILPDLAWRGLLDRYQRGEPLRPQPQPSPK
ncbi:hypothetical protein AYO42_00085 [Rhizomicrobium sp. SCGC AG-212-E05]|nr:hypothetical protein AYO42_00085 [Rhizomicrobium sp. SCGC AG-212-E05]